MKKTVDNNPTPVPTETNDGELSAQQLDGVSGGLVVAPVTTVNVTDILKPTLPIGFTGNITGGSNNP